MLSRAYIVCIHDVDAWQRLISVTALVVSNCIMKDMRLLQHRSIASPTKGDVMCFVLWQAAQAAGKYLIEKFIVHGLVAAVSLPMTLLSVSSLIDSQWTVVSLLCTLPGDESQHDMRQPL